MDDFVVAFTGVILQVLGLVLSFGTFVLGVIELVLKLASKDTPRSSPEDEPELHK
ncbi:MAG: hypothetical protein RRZ85_04835 [Gordonibacter sp.]|uniref:hypothetical protein n=1 Tax=Gordonibacter sp. TaxID=1968902 RepID=UPI002FC69FFB